MNYFWELFVNGFCGSSIVGWRLRKIIFRMIGIKLESNTAIHRNCYISGKNLILQSGSYINRNCILDCTHASLIIGKNVGIGYNCSFFTTNHDYSNPSKRTGRVEGKDIIIGDGSWIGGGYYHMPRDNNRRRLYYCSWKCSC